MKYKINSEIEKLIPKLTEEEYRQLEANIIKDGCLDPLITGYIKQLKETILLDGHNRHHICNSNKLANYTKNIELETLDDAKVWCINNQMGRRNINSFVRIELSLLSEEIISKKAKEHQRLVGGAVPTTLKEAPIDTNKELAKLARVSVGTLDKVRKIKKTIKDESILKDLKDGKKTINEVFKEIKNTEKQEARKNALKIATKNYKESEDIKIYFGDCLDVTKKEIKANSVDVIITDPPYPYEFIDCWTKLAKLADYALKPSGLVIAMSGQLYLPEVMDRLGEHLKYYWTMAVELKGQKQIVHPVNVQCGWKPILIFQKSPKKKIGYCPLDYLVSPLQDKQDHEWQQSLSIYEI